MHDLPGPQASEGFSELGEELDNRTRRCWTLGFEGEQELSLELTQRRWISSWTKFAPVRPVHPEGLNDLEATISAEKRWPYSLAGK